MSISIDGYPNPYGVDTLTAYAWIGTLSLDFATGNGKLQIRINSDVSSAIAQKPPVEILDVFMSSEIGDGSPAFPTLMEFVSDNQEHFDAIRTYLYSKLLLQAKFSDGTLVP